MRRTRAPLPWRCAVDLTYGLDIDELADTTKRPDGDLPRPETRRPRSIHMPHRGGTNEKPVEFSIISQLHRPLL